MRTTLTGPGTNKYKPKDDIGKTAGAAKSDSGYRRPGTAASGLLYLFILVFFFYTHFNIVTNFIRSSKCYC